MKHLSLSLLCLLILTSCGKSTPADKQSESPSIPTKAQAAASAPPACPTKANTLTVCKDGICVAMGEQSFGFDSGTGGLNYAGGGQLTVYVFRSFSESKAAVERAGLATGKAFTRLPDGKWQYLCDVDPASTDEQLRAKFGIVYGATPSTAEAAASQAQ